MPGPWWRRALEQRLTTLVAAALILWTVGTTIAASLATARIADAVRAERRLQGRQIAHQIEAAVTGAQRQLDVVAGAAVVEDVTQLTVAVRAISLADSVTRLDAVGRPLWARAVADGREITPSIDRLPHLPGAPWRAETTMLLDTGGGPRLFVIIPARESDVLGGAFAASINPSTGALRAAVLATAAPYRVALVDAAGRTIASNYDHAVAADALVATVAVANTPWAVELAQPRAEALAPVLTLRRILVGSSLVLIPFAVLAAMATARSIRRPVLAMTNAAERLAHGERTTPIPRAGEDEIGRLAAALERLRLALEGDERRSLLLKRIITAQEEERRRIARELHDQTTQQLTALAMQLHSLAASRPDTAGALSPSRELVRSAIDDVHRLIYDLRPAMLDDLGLLPAIRSFAATRLGAHGVVVHSEFPPELPGLTREATVTLFRAVQEVITNIARHARAETVFIGCTASDDRLVLEIEDDGVGFDPAQVATPRPTGEGLGLLGIRERMALVGGRVDVESEPGGGTRVVLVLPLPAHMEAA